MQLQRSLFSFYRVFVRKTPLVFWAAFACLLLLIITWEFGQLFNAKPVYNFDLCMMQFFNVTRTVENDTLPSPIEHNKTIANETSNHTRPEQNQGKKPFFLQSSFYNFLNETSTIKLYLSDKIEFKQGETNCQIILNTQKIRAKEENKNDDNGVDGSRKAGQNVKVQQAAEQVKILQQIELEKKKEQNAAQPQNEERKKNSEKTKQSKQFFSLVPLQRPANIRNFDEITNEEHQFLLSEHSFMHITGNQHVAYLDQNNEFEEKHNVQIHAIFLSKQQFEEYPDTFFGVSSKIWRLHGNELITRNANILRSMGETFLNVQNKVKEIYEKALFSVNLLISVKKAVNEIKVNGTTNGTDGVNQTKKEGNLVKETETNEGKNNQTLQKNSISPTETNQTQLLKQQMMAIMQQLPNQIIPLQLIFPLSPLKLYFHYPQTLRVEDISRLASYVQTSSSLIYKAISVLLFYGSLLIISAVIGLLLRYLFFGLVSMYLFICGCLVNRQWGWVQKYFNLVRNRFTPENAGTSIKIIVFFVFAFIGSLITFTMGIKYILQNILILTMSFSELYYAEMLLKNYFIIEMFYFVCCRTRVGLKFFPLFSFVLSVLILFANQKFYCYHISWLMNLHLILHLFLITIFIGIQNFLGNSQFYSEFTPSEDKPRALFYAAYDISWQNTLPPIWTYFTTYFDWRYFGERERVLINKDYQMLYGRLLGMNERQELPEDDEDEEEGKELNESHLSESNEINLIR